MATQAQITAVQQLYVSYLGRAADKAGLDFWSNAIATGTSTIESVATGLTLATEYTTAYGNLSNDALVDAVYTNVLGRSADAAGKAFWVAAFGNGTVKADTFVASLIQSLGTQDQATINNKTFVAQTYTDTVGDMYTPAGGAAVITGVTSDPATVTTAIGTIATGTAPGLIPGLAQITALSSAQAAVTAFEKATATGSLSTSVTGLDADKNGSVSLSELNSASGRADTAHDNAVGAGVTTATAQATLTNLNNALTTAKANAVAASSATAVANLDAALATQVTVQGTTADQNATASAKASALAGFTTALAGQSGPNAVTADTLNATTLAANDIDGTDTTADVYAALTSTSLSSNERAALVTEVNKLGTFGAALVTAADKEVAVAKANAAVDAASTAVGSTASAYKSALTDQKTQSVNVDKAVAADAQKADIKVAIDAHTALDTTSTKAAAAVAALNSDKVAVSDLGVKTDAGAGTTAIAAGSTVNVSVKSDVFYFGATKAASVDFAIGTGTGANTFGAGDSIVIGSGYTFNSGALSTGHNDTSEFFLVQGSAGVQVVIENTVFGSATAPAPAATGVIAANAGDGLSVITLTGVSIDHVSVANGVVSYV